MLRRESILLDGVWQFATDDQDIGREQGWFESGSAFSQSIPVPGCWQAREIYCQTGWYRRSVIIPDSWRGRRIGLRFAGVSYETDVWINGQPAIHHEGLMLPFEGDVSAKLIYGEANVIVVRVAQYDYPNGFQTEQLGDKLVGVYGCWITWGGIFQSVSLEATEPVWIDHVFLIPDIDHERITARVRLRNQTSAAHSLQVRVNVEPGIFAGAAATLVPASGSVSLDIPVMLSHITLWHPDQPFLYTAEVTISEGEITLDNVSKRFGMRHIEVQGKQILLNHQPIFLRGWLDDAVYPEQISPTISLDDARAILSQCKTYGFNFVRHHTHIPVTAFHKAADELGVLQLQEFASFGSIGNPRVDPTRKTRQQIFEIWRGMIERDCNHPSLIAYGVNNECWHEHEFLSWAPVYRDLYQLGKQLDPTRLIIDNSGGEDHWSVASDVYDKHIYQFPTEQEMERSTEGRPHRAYIQGRSAYFNVDLAQISKPCLVTEVGGWCTFPDFSKIRAHSGGKIPWWLSRDRMRNPRMNYAPINRMETEMPPDLYPRIVANSERFAAIANKIQVEHMRQTPGISGYAYCTFTDCYNWGSGILDNYFEPKSYAHMFAELNQASVLLWLRDRWCFRAGQSIDVGLAISHYGDQPVTDGSLRWRLSADDRLLRQGALDHLSAGCYGIHDFAPFALDLPSAAEAVKLTLSVELTDSHHSLRNEWSLWVFPNTEIDFDGKTVVYDGDDFARWQASFPLLRNADETGAEALRITSLLTEAHVRYLEGGGRLLWLQKGSELSCRPYNQDPAVDYRATIVNEHPISSTFPNEGWCDMQFHHLIGSAVLDTGYFETFTPIIEAFHVPYWMQNPRILPFRRKSFLAEAEVGAGRLLTTTFVFEGLGEYPEVDAMAQAVIAYLLKPTPSAAQRLTGDDLREWAWGSVHGMPQTDYVPFLM
jgi:beta-galactosidase